MLRPQDILIALKLAVCDGSSLSYAELARQLGLSASQAFDAVRRAAASQLVDLGDPRRARRRELLEFAVHGVRYVIPAERGPVARGVPTAHAAPPLRQHFAADTAPIVWADPEGTLRGESLVPIYKTVPFAARQDPALHQLLALVDAIRVGRARERELATGELAARLGDEA